MTWDGQGGRRREAAPRRGGVEEEGKGGSLPSRPTTELLPTPKHTQTHTLPSPSYYKLRCTDEILMVLLGRIMNLLLPGVVHRACNMRVIA